MKKILKIIVPALLMTLALMQLTFAESEDSDCKVCKQVQSYQLQKAKDEKKAAVDFGEYIAEVKLSSDAKILKKELEAILITTAQLLDLDDEQNIPQYLVSIEDENPKVFAESMKVLSDAEQKNIKSYMDPARDMFLNGEPSVDSDSEKKSD